MPQNKGLWAPSWRIAEPAGILTNGLVVPPSARGPNPKCVPRQGTTVKLNTVENAQNKGLWALYERRRAAQLARRACSAPRPPPGGVRSRAASGGARRARAAARRPPTTRAPARPAVVPLAAAAPARWRASTAGGARRRPPWGTRAEAAARGARRAGCCRSSARRPPPCWYAPSGPAERNALERVPCATVARRCSQGSFTSPNGGRMRSGGAQQCGKRSQPAPELHLGGTGVAARSLAREKHSFAAAAAAAAPRAGGARGAPSAACILGF